MACGSKKIKYTCGQKQFAVCTYYETDVPEWSSLLEEDCVVIEETTEELYNEVTDIKDSLDNSELGDDCLDYPTQSDGSILQKDVNLVHEENICNILDTLSATKNDFSLCNLDYGTLLNPEDCDEKPQTFCEFAQFILNQLNTLKNG